MSHYQLTTVQCNELIGVELAVCVCDRKAMCLCAPPAKNALPSPVSQVLILPDVVVLYHLPSGTHGL